MMQLITSTTTVTGTTAGRTGFTETTGTNNTLVMNNEDFHFWSEIRFFVFHEHVKY